LIKVSDAARAPAPARKKDPVAPIAEATTELLRRSETRPQE